MTQWQRKQAGFALIVTLWIIGALSLIALSFSRTVLLQQRRCSNAVGAIQACQAVAGARRYAAAVIQSSTSVTTLPGGDDMLLEAIPIGEAHAWFLAAPAESEREQKPVFGLVDEGAKLNLNSATRDMLLGLPGMTAELAAAIIDWRDEDDDPTAGGAEAETYLRLDPAYLCKNRPFESVEELRLVYGADLDLLYGRDSNLNHVLDEWEENATLDMLKRDKMPANDRGLLHYLTVWSTPPAEADAEGDSEPAIDVNDAETSRLIALIREQLDSETAETVQRALARGRPRFNSLLQFAFTVGLSAEQLARIEDRLRVTSESTIIPVNVNTASAVVLGCMPGISPDDAAALVAYRNAYPDSLESITWIAQVLSQENAVEAAPYLSTHSSRFSADIVALGPGGRGYCRVFMVFDTGAGTPQVIYSRDRSALGWALGADIRQEYAP